MGRSIEQQINAELDRLDKEVTEIRQHVDACRQKMRDFDAHFEAKVSGSSAAARGILRDHLMAAKKMLDTLHSQLAVVNGHHKDARRAARVGR